MKGFTEEAVSYRGVKEERCRRKSFILPSPTLLTTDAHQQRAADMEKSLETTVYWEKMKEHWNLICRRDLEIRNSLFVI